MNIKGKTLIELLVALLIFSSMMLGFYALMNFVNTRSFLDSVRVDMQQQARNGMERIMREVRESSTIAITVVDANSDELSFTTPNEVGIQYYRDGINLVREYPPDTTKIIASNILYLKFTQAGNLLQIQIRADKSLKSQTISVLLTEKVRLRNE